MVAVCGVAVSARVVYTTLLCVSLPPRQGDLSPHCYDPSAARVLDHLTKTKKSKDDLKNRTHEYVTLLYFGTLSGMFRVLTGGQRPPFSSF